MTQNEKQIHNLRKQFLTKLEDETSQTPDLFHPADINRVKVDDGYLKRFLMHHDWNQTEAFNMLWETCTWRKEFGVNDISEDNVNINILESGSVFSHGKDKDGKTLLIFKSKKHVKGAYDFEDQKRCLVYWMERLERQDNGDMISLFFDMDGAVLANMDLEYTKYLIGLLKNYYPYFLNYIIIFEMAWVLSAVFKMIKSWLPPKAVGKMKFVNKSNVKDYVDLEHALKSWGGKSYYVFQFEPELKTTSLPVSGGGGDDNRKKVHFADSFTQDQLNESGFEDSSAPTPNSVRLSITPTEIMMFTQEGSEVTSFITLNNEDSQSVLYKVKTTAPEKFRVRPSSGVLTPGGATKISVGLHPGYFVQTLQRDKFLIMSITTDKPDMSQQEINDLWKQKGDKDVFRHRLRCAIPQLFSNDYSVKNGSTYSSQSTDDQKLVTKVCADITKLNPCINSIKEEIKLIKRQLWIVTFTMIFIVCYILYVIYYYYYYKFNAHSSGPNCYADSRKEL